MGTRGRKALPISQAILRKVIAELEEKQSFSSRSALWAAVADTKYAKSVGLTAQTAMLRAEKWGIALKTPKGQRGRTKGQGFPAGATPGRKSKRMPLPLVETLRAAMPAELSAVVDKAAKGSLRAAVKLLCIDCSGGSKKEVSLCEITTCPLWWFRPYKRNKNAVADIPSNPEEVERAEADAESRHVD